MTIADTGHRTHRRTRAHLPLIAGGAALLLATPALSAVRVQIFNFAPLESGSGGALSFLLGGQAQVDGLPYRGQSAFITLANPSFDLEVLDARGQAVIRQRIVLTDGRDHVLAAAGDGVRRPLKAFQALEHADVVQHGAFTLQSAHLATHGSFNDPVNRYHYTESCDQPAPFVPNVPLNPLPREDGYAAANVSMSGNRAGPCIRLHHLVQHADGRIERLATEFAAEPGERIRAFAIGDGQRQPYEQVLYRYGAQATVAIVPPTAAMEGLWYDPERPGEGMAVHYDAASAKKRTRIMYYGFNDQNQPNWGVNLTGGTAVIETIVGGAADGRQPTATNVAGFVNFRFHSCNTASFVTSAPTALIRHTEADRLRARRLVKLLPLDNCAP